MGTNTQIEGWGMERRNRQKRKRINAKAGHKNKDLLQ